MNIRLFKCTALATVIGFFAVACEDETMQPSFPEVGPLVVVKTEETITFVPNMDWEISVPNETISFFWIIDEEKGNVNKIKGKAGSQKVTVRIGITDEPDFNKDIRCNVTMKMGDQERVIAEYTLLKSVREFKAYPGEVDERGFIVFREEGGLEYRKESSDNIEIAYHRTYGFALPVRLSSGVNYDMIDSPDWMDVELYSKSPVGLGARGDCEVLFRVKEGVELPVDEPLTGAVVFSVRKNREDILKTLNVSFKPLTGFVSWESDTEIFFDGDGVYGGGITEGQNYYAAEVYSSEGVIFFAAAEFTREGMQGTFWTGTDVDWVTISDSWDNSGAAFQRREVTIRMTPNTGAERSADIYAIPASLAKSIAPNRIFDTATDPLNDQYNDVKESIKPYKVATLIQDIGGALISLVSPAEGATLSQVPAEWFDPDNAAWVSKYEIAIRDFSIEKLYEIKTSVKEFDIVLAKTPGVIKTRRYIPGVTSESDTFKEDDGTFNVTNADGTIKVVINSDKAVEGGIAFQTSDLLPIAALWIEYTPAE